MNTQTFVISAVGASTLIAAGSTIARGETPRATLFIGGTVAAFTLSVMAGPLPGIARGLAWLTIIGTLLGTGYDLINKVRSIVSS